MNAEIITIGDELLIGQVINTNQAFIAEQLNTAGIAVSRMVTVGDTEGEILRSFDEAWKRVNVVLVQRMMTSRGGLPASSSIPVWFKAMTPSRRFSAFFPHAGFP